MTESAPTSPWGIFASLWRNRSLIALMTKREAVGRYHGSMLGLLWSFFHPLLMLTVYTFVFGIVFKARWPALGESTAGFAVVLFAGLMVYAFVSECLNRSPGLIVNNVNYVKKVVFPLEILPWVAVGSALFHLAVSFFVWLVFHVVLFGLPPVTAIYFPVVLLPLMFTVLGFSWLLASLGVFIRDVSHFIGIVTTALLFLTPIFYPLSALPPRLQSLMVLNPLAFAVEQVRSVLIYGRAPDWSGYGIFLFASLTIAWAGHTWFQKTRRGFADVL